MTAVLTVSIEQPTTAPTEGAPILLTAEQFWELYENKPFELINGVPVEMSPTGALHQVVSLNCGAILREFVLKNRLGYVGASEGGYKLATNPDIIRGADASFIRFERVSGEIPDGYFPVAPDLAVEVVSPGDRASEIMEKVNEYRAAGTPLIWVIYPKLRQVMVYHSGRDAQVLSGTDQLEGGDVLPGFSISITDLWPPEYPASPVSPTQGV